ncbi:MAG: ABC transporter permease [Lachnospiraceae bacterium]|nr:ABC transporter permease [Lachnospiraceae bacterium]
MRALVISGLKLLFRNKGFWFFILITPLASVMLLNVHQANTSYYHVDEGSLTELSGPDYKVAYFGGDGRYIIKVYDACGDEYSEYFLGSLSNGGLFGIYRADAAGMTPADYTERTVFDGESDRMGASVYIAPDFEASLREGHPEKGLEISILSDDPREEILTDEINIICGRMIAAFEIMQNGDAISFLRDSEEEMPGSSVAVVGSSRDTLLTNEQIDNKTSIGYAMAVMSMGYVFCGIFVAHTIMEERRDKVATRIDITGFSPVSYFLAKFVTGLAGTVVLTVILGIGFAFVRNDYGISKLSVLALIFFMGIIFNCMSIMIGIFAGDTMTANIIAFTLWSFSSMLSGTFFPLKNATSTVIFLSSLMPQKWFMDALDEVFLGSGKVTIMVLCILGAYLFAMTGLGSVGIRIVKNGE